MHTQAFWLEFNLFVLLMLALDLGIFNRKVHIITIKEALIWSGIWVSLALVFNVFVYYWYGEQKALEFLTGYLVEKSLSVDNIFVFVLVFRYFQIPPIYQHKVLFWGILGALVMRVIFIFAGVALIEKFHWTVYLFGVFLIYTGYKMFSEKDKKLEPEKNIFIRLVRRIIPVSQGIQSEKFFIRENGRTHATPLFLVLLFIEATDLIFAVDSIPAILAITQDEFMVYTSNVFAILGLRSLYFALAHLIDRFVYLTYGLALILVFVGVKMVFIDVFKIPIFISLLVIAFVISASVILSFLKTRRNAN
ncbi:TerC family protein [Desertivirga xinjiangensis]|uniref:TerC family protein n=1 Tax=Desertivirga xinjiangensis TaxID=539206 RepID=UPI00210A435E|nr:TerC family protein [Pedobacter xinjiangensis]